MSIITAARDAADRLLLLDKCTITRLGDPVFDPNTGTYNTPTVTVASDVACNLTPYTGAGTVTEQFGGMAVTTRRYRLSLRYDTPETVEEDTVEITESADPGLIGRTFRVEHVEGETFQTARRLVVEAVGNLGGDES